MFGRAFVKTKIAIAEERACQVVPERLVIRCSSRRCDAIDDEERRKVCLFQHIKVNLHVAAPAAILLVRKIFDDPAIHRCVILPAAVADDNRIFAFQIPRAGKEFGHAVAPCGIHRLRGVVRTITVDINIPIIQPRDTRPDVVIEDAVPQPRAHNVIMDELRQILVPAYVVCLRCGICDVQHVCPRPGSEAPAVRARQPPSFLNAAVQLVEWVVGVSNTRVRQRHFLRRHVHEQRNVRIPLPQNREHFRMSVLQFRTENHYVPAGKLLRLRDGDVRVQVIVGKARIFVCRCLRDNVKRNHHSACENEHDDASKNSVMRGFLHTHA